MGLTVGTLKDKETCGHVTWGQALYPSSWGPLGCSTCPKRQYVKGDIKPAGQPGSAGQEAVEQLRRYLLSVAQERGNAEEHVFCAAEPCLFYKKVGKQTYMMQMCFLDENVICSLQEANPYFP